MFLKAAASIILCTSFILGNFPLRYFPDVNKKGADFKPAAYDGYEVTLADGVKFNMNIAGGRMIFDSEVARNYNIQLIKTEKDRVVRSFTMDGTSYDVELEKFMDEDTIYTVSISYEAYGLTVSSSDNLIFKNGKNIYFWKSVNYEYNLNTCSELWTDSQSLKECLEPQNDIECDDPVLIAYSNNICAGAADDWEKVFRIYTFIASEMAYDNVEAEDSVGGYQDSAVDILRDGKGLCEGFSNCFVALCRAQGIPAAVEFGIGFADYDEMTTRVPTDEDFADHAWAAVYLGDRWHFSDPTFDMVRYYNGPGDVDVYEYNTSYYLMPLESFSNDHRIYDADTRHGIPSAGYCGEHAQYEITRDGVCYISGWGTIKMPQGVNCFNKIVFDPESEITVIDEDCFIDCDLITTVILPDTVISINDCAFNSCEDLEYIYIPNGVTYIGQESFDCCDELSYVYIPDSVETIGMWAFDDDPRLYISLPSRFTDLTYEYNLDPMHIEYRYE